jgi:hypothetical protein
MDYEIQSPQEAIWSAHSLAILHKTIAVLTTQAGEHERALSQWAVSEGLAPREPLAHIPGQG